MSKTSFNELPEWIQYRILESLDFANRLKARVICKSWNSYLNQLLAPSSILNIRLDSNVTSKRFRHGKWVGSLMIQCHEVRLVPKDMNAFIKGKAKNNYVSSLSNLTQVKKFTLYENGSFLHFVHRYMPLLSRVKYVQIRELDFDKNSKSFSTDSKYTYLAHVYTCAVRHMKSWSRCQENLSQVETLRIRLYDRLATMVYIQVFTFRLCNLVNVELDFSKFFGLPLDRYYLNELNGGICDLLEHCFLTLRQLRLKWAVRVETDFDYARSDEDIAPFFEFLLALRNPVWRKLRLDLLFLSFPAVNFALNLCETYFFPVLEKLAPRALRINLSRVMPNAGLEAFMRHMPPSTYHKFEFNFYFLDGELHPQPVPLVRGLEILFVNNLPADQTAIASISRMRLAGAKHCQSLKLLNGHDNVGFTKPNVFILTEYFHNLKNLELIDCSEYGKVHCKFSTEDFNLIVRRLGRLCVLRMSNAQFEDAILCNIPEDEVNRMKSKGVYYLKVHKGAPVSNAKELRFLDLRDLPYTISDFSVYFAFQHIPKLEKISFHGSHFITDWGKKLLERRKGKNPSFSVYFKSVNEEQFVLGNYANPCADFP